ncbi:MAG: HEAT repeat domain-containing protein [Caldilineaceae bacterium]
MDQQVDHLEQVFARLEKLNLPFLAHSPSGLDERQLEQIASKFDLKLPAEVQRYFLWRNVSPMRQFELFPLGYMCPLEDAVDTREHLISLNDDIPPELVITSDDQPIDYLSNPLARLEQPLDWKPFWLPLFIFQGDTFWFTICGETQEPVAPIYYIYLVGDFYLAYDNLTSLLLATAEAFEKGVYYMEGNLIREKPVEAARIIEKYNPMRRQYLLTAAGGSRTVDDLFDVIVSQKPADSGTAFRALRLLSDSQITDILKSLVRHQDAGIRLSAIEVIYERNDLSAKEALSKIADGDPVSQVKTYADWVLQQWKQLRLG